MAKLGRAIPLFTRMFPKASGPRGLQYTFGLDTLTQDIVSISLTNVGLDFINGVFVDNSLNGSGFTLSNVQTGQIVYVPAYSQANLALITAQNTDNIQFTGSSTGGVIVPVIFRNTEPVSDAIWSTVAAGQIIGAVTVQGQVTALPYLSAGIDGSGTIVTGGTAQLLFAANAARKGLFISNPASPAGQNTPGQAPESLFVKYGSAPAIGAGNVIEIAPGGFLNPQGVADNRAIWILAATSGHVFDAQQYQ